MSEVTTEQPQSSIPKDLQDQMGAVEACATAFNVLDKGYFPHSYAQAVKASLVFLKKLHEQSVEQALQHPEAEKHPDLEKIVKARKKADGKAKKKKKN